MGRVWGGRGFSKLKFLKYFIYQTLLNFRNSIPNPSHLFVKNPNPPVYLAIRQVERARLDRINLNLNN